MSPPARSYKKQGPHLRQTHTNYLRRHQTNIIVGWKPCMRRNYVVCSVWVDQYPSSKPPPGTSCSHYHGNHMTS